MKRNYKLWFLVIALTSLFAMRAYTQPCTVTASANPAVVCVGQNSVITANAFIPGSNYSFDFNTGNAPTGWSLTGTSTFSATGCAAPSLTNDPFFWSGTNGTVTPSIATSDLDVSGGGNVIFDFRFFPNSSSAPCETADQYNEGVIIEYSLDAGVTWTTIVYLCPVPTGGPWAMIGGYAQTLAALPASTTPGNGNGSTGIFNNWATYTIPIPAAAQTVSTRFRWRQPNSSGSCCDNWGLDNINIAASPSLNYTWSNQIGGGQILDGFNANTLTLFNLQTDSTYIIVVTDTLTGLSCSTSVTIEVNPIPQAVINWDAPVCVNQPFAFDASGSQPSSTITYYNIDFDNNGSLEYHSSNPIGSTPGFASPGVYNFRFEVIDTSSGCSAHIDTSFIVNITPSVNLLSNKTTICQGEVVNFQAQASVSQLPSIPTNIANYSWDFVTFDTSGNAMNAFANGFAQPGIYDVVVTVSTNHNCSKRDTVRIIVHSSPEADFPDIVICGGNELFIPDSSTIQAPYTITNWNWTVTNSNSGFNENQNTQNYSGLVPDTGIYTVRLIVTTQDNCHDTITKNIPSVPKPTADFVASGCVDFFNLQSTSSGGTTPYSYQWDVDNNGTIDYTTEFVSHKYAVAGPKEIVFIVVDKNTCVDTLTKTVESLQPSDPPNVLSLESDIGNDVLVLESFMYCDYTLRIFNRWGNKVYEYKNDGNNPDINCEHCFKGKTPQGVNLSQGTYFYVLEAEAGYEYKGTITIFE